jgi:hypothetical protein
MINLDRQADSDLILGLYISNVFCFGLIFAQQKKIQYECIKGWKKLEKIVQKSPYFEEKKVRSCHN